MNALLLVVLTIIAAVLIVVGILGPTWVFAIGTVLLAGTVVMGLRAGQPARR